MEFRIRPFRDSDIADINEIRSMRGVMETIPTLFSESVAFTEKVMKSVGPNDPALSAVIETPEGYQITEKGARNADAVESSLPYSVRTKALKLIAPVEERMRRAAMITAEHSVTEDGCTVHLAMADGKGKIIDLSFLCAGEEQAAEIEKRFRRSAEEYYQRIAQMFTE